MRIITMCLDAGYIVVCDNGPDFYKKIETDLDWIEIFRGTYSDFTNLDARPPEIVFTIQSVQNIKRLNDLKAKIIHEMAEKKKEEEGEQEYKKLKEHIEVKILKAASSGQIAETIFINTDFWNRIKIDFKDFKPTINSKHNDLVIFTWEV